MKQMLRKQPWSLIAGLALVAAAPLSAEAHDGFYAGIEGGINFMYPEDVVNNNGVTLVPPATTQQSNAVVFNNQFKDGFLVGLTSGYAFSWGLRPELAIDYRDNGVKSANVNFNTPPLTAAPGAYTSGHDQSYAEMANVWYDVKSKDSSSPLSFIHPYAGFGVGFAQVGIRETVESIPDAIDDKKNLFAYQFGAGVGFDITPKLTMSFDYRFLQTQAGNFAISNSVIHSFNGVMTDNGTLQSRYRASTPMLSLHYSFGGKSVANHEDDAISTDEFDVPTRVDTSDNDSDGDGVPDDLDRCPNTPKGFKVDATGCIVKQTVVLRTVNFQFNSDQLTDPAKQTLDGIVAALKGQPTLQVEIDGFTDSVGSARYNRTLSEKRAVAVRNYLLKKGIDGSLLSARGFGEDKPIADNDSEDGRAENRRVEFVVLGGTSDDATVTTAGSTSESRKAALERH